MNNRSKFRFIGNALRVSDFMLEVRLFCFSCFNSVLNRSLFKHLLFALRLAGMIDCFVLRFFYENQ